MKEKIFVIYVGVAGIRSEDINNYVRNVTAKITPSTFKGEIIVVPTQSPNTVIACINPEYITDDDLIKKHTDLMKELNEHLENQLKQLKEK